MKRKEYDMGAKSFRSIYLGLIYVLLIALLSSFFLFVILDLSATAYIDNKYLSEERREEREESYFSDLEAFTAKNNLSTGELERLTEWLSKNRYFYVMICEETALLLDSADAYNKGAYPGTGVIVDLPAHEVLRSLAVSGSAYTLSFSDGELTVYCADFTEYLYYDIISVSSLALSVILFLTVVLIYFRGVAGRIRRLATDVTAVAEGDLNRTITPEGSDELARLAMDVENMRSSLLETLKSERAAVKANNELITSMSHDLRTPLTVLLGYLDMMKLYAEENEIMKDYIKASEKTALRMKTLSDDMFNYFLVFGGESEPCDIQEYDARTLTEQMLAEHELLLSELGYNVMVSGRESAELSGLKVMTNAQSLMRIIENLFSNISKYAEMSAPVSIAIKVEKSLSGSEELKLLFTNSIRRDSERTESNRIGLKTCRKIAGMIGVGFSAEEDHKIFSARVSIPAKREESTDG